MRNYLVSPLFEEWYDVGPTRDDADGALVSLPPGLGHVHQLLAETLTLVIRMNRHRTNLRHAVVRHTPNATNDLQSVQWISFYYYRIHPIIRRV